VRNLTKYLKRKKKVLAKSPLTNKGVVIFVSLFAVVGTYLLINSFAASGAGLNTTGANVFISTTGSDTSCKRYASPVAAMPGGDVACATAARAYELMSNGDTAWIMPGNYGTAHAFDFEKNAPSSYKTSVGTDCNSTNSCFYFIPKPGQETAVTYTNADGDGYPGFKQGKTPDNLYYANIKGAKGCPSFSLTSPSATADNIGQAAATAGFAKDITVKNNQGTDCTLYMQGHWSYVRVIGLDNSYTCDTEGQAGGSNIGANESVGLDGETSNHIYAPDHITIDSSYFHDYNINGCGPAQPHQDCIHPRAMTNSTIRNSKFDNCFDSSILWDALDEPGYPENNIIENNWFGPTQLGNNNCCLRGGNTPSEEVFDNFIIRFNTSTSDINNKSINVFNNVQFIGNVAMGSNVCAGGIWKYNILGSGACDSGTDTGGATNSLVKLKNLNNGTLDLHIQAGSSAIGYVPTSLANGCSTAGLDFDGDARPTGAGLFCDAGSDQLGGSGGGGGGGQTANVFVAKNGSDTGKHLTRHTRKPVLAT
jgi:hypothetical protein